MITHTLDNNLHWNRSQSQKLSLYPLKLTADNTVGNVYLCKQNGCPDRRKNVVWMTRSLSQVCPIPNNPPDYRLGAKHWGWRGHESFWLLIIGDMRIVQNLVEKRTVSLVLQKLFRVLTPRYKQQRWLWYLAGSIVDE